MNSPRHCFRKLAAPSGALSVGALAALLGPCCGAPWLVAAIGVTGAIAVARLAFLAPYLWLLAFGFAVAGLVWAYRAEPTCDTACAQMQQRGLKIVTWLVMLTLLGLFVAVRGWRLLIF